MARRRSRAARRKWKPFSSIVIGSAAGTPDGPDVRELADERTDRSATLTRRRARSSGRRTRRRPSLRHGRGHRSARGRRRRGRRAADELASHPRRTATPSSRQRSRRRRRPCAGLDVTRRPARRVRRARVARASLLELGEARVGGREEQVADLLEERRRAPGRAGARAGERHLGLGRELLADAAHRLPRRAPGDLPPSASTTSPRRGGRGGRRSMRRSRPRRLRRLVPPAQLLALALEQPPQRPADILPDRHPPQPRMSFSAMTREALDRGAELTERWRGPRSAANDRRDLVRVRGREPGDGARGPARSPSKSSDSAPTKTSSPSSRYGCTLSNGVSETFSPARFVARSRSLDSTVTGRRSRSHARTRRRRTGPARTHRGGLEVIEQRALVEREVRRPDHRDPGSAGLGGMLGEGDQCPRSSARRSGRPPAAGPARPRGRTRAGR